MSLHEQVAKLGTLVGNLKPQDVGFATNLIDFYKKYGKLSVKQAEWVGKLIVRATSPVVVQSPPVAAIAAPVNVGGFAGVVALFQKAQENGLKFPKIRLVLNGIKLILSFTGPKALKPGYVRITGEGKYPLNTFYGKVSPEGDFISYTSGDFKEALVALLTQLGKNPARVAKEHGKLTGNCCFCGKSVGDGKEVRSVLAGFGPDCAARYNLKAEWLAAADKAAKVSVTPLKLEGPWHGSSSLDDTYGTVVKTVAHTFTATPISAKLVEPQIPLSTFEFDDEVGISTSGWDSGDAEPVTVTTGTNSLHITTETPVGDVVTCFFCEKATGLPKELSGITVCPECIAVLTAD